MNLKILIYLTFLFCNIVFSQIAIIANHSVPKDSITKGELLNFYSGDIRHWDDEQPVVAFDLKSKFQLRNAFYELIGKSSSRMRSIWLKMVLSGEGDPPKAHESEETLISAVAKTPGSIGFIDNKTTINNNGVKILVLLE